MSHAAAIIEVVDMLLKFDDFVLLFGAYVQ